MKKLNINLSGFTKNVQTRLEVLHGVEYIVAPVTMIVEGVLPGSAGPILYTANEIEASIMYWNGIPVTINHPSDSEGNPVSARIPSVIEEFGVGHIYNTTFDPIKNALKAEAWINKVVLETKFPNVYSSILDDNANMEVSTGVFFDSRGDSGAFNNVSYDTTAYNYVGDHLALLPTATGACSWNDGCGLRANSSSKKQVKPIFNELAYQDISRSLGRMVDVFDDNSYYHYIDAVYDTYFIFEKVALSGDRSRTLWKQGYTKTNDVVTPTGEPQRVMEQRIYTVISEDAIVPSEISTITNENKTQKESEMANDKPCCPEKVKSLIAATTNSFTEADTDMLLSLNEKQLESVVAMSEELVANAIKKEEKGGEELASKMTTQDFIKDAPEHIQLEINKLLEKAKAEKQELISNILKNENCTFNEQELDKFDIDVLLKVSGLAKKEVAENASLETNDLADMTANASGEKKAIIPGTQATLAENEILKAPKIDWTKKA